MTKTLFELLFTGPLAALQRQSFDDHLRGATTDLRRRVLGPRGSLPGAAA